jgi:endogenous inhibitor of DNA gyrase (YacG/DUF329 family)
MSTMKIPLTGKHAVGPYSFALVDASDYPELAQWKWKAKWNAAGNHVYAVRNVGNSTLRMHRVILGLGAFKGDDVDHINHESLDNRRSNLRVVSRSVNVKNARKVCTLFACADCGKESAYVRTHTKRSVCDECALAKKKAYVAASAPSVTTILISECKQCTEAFVHKLSRGTFCSDRCRLTALATARRQFGRKATRVTDACLTNE